MVALLSCQRMECDCDFWQLHSGHFCRPQLVPPWLIAVLAALPGLSIGVFQRFSYYRRARWHTCVETQLKAFVRAIEYENADPGEISKQFSAFMIHMEPLYPGTGLEGLGEFSAIRTQVPSGNPTISDTKGS
jgi:hypothetical protein